MRNSKHILIENPEFEEITEAYKELLEKKLKEEKKEKDRLRYYRLDCKVKDTFKGSQSEVECVLWFDDRSGQHGFRRLEIVVQLDNDKFKNFLLYDLDQFGESEWNNLF